jgi:hypothetical protein
MPLLIALAVLVFSAAESLAQFQIPRARDPLVNDYARMLSDAAETRLRSDLRPLRDRGIHATVLTVGRLRDFGAKPERIGEFATAVYADWGIGVRGVDKGALVLVAKDDHKWFVKLGRGYDAWDRASTFNAVRDALAPHFRREDYAEGLSAAIEALRRHVFDPAERPVSASAPPQPAKGSTPVNPVDALIEEERRHQAESGFDVERDANFDVEPVPDVRLPGDPIPQETAADPPYLRKEWRERQSTPYHPGFSFGCGSWICWLMGLMLVASFFRRRRPPAWGGGMPYRRYGGGFSWGSALGGFILGSLLRGGSRGGSSYRGGSSGGWGGGMSGGGGGGFFGGGKSGGGFGGGW